MHHSSGSVAAVTLENTWMRMKGTKLIQVYLLISITAPFLSIAWHQKEPLGCAVYSHCPTNDSYNTCIYGCWCLLCSYVTKLFSALRRVIRSQSVYTSFVHSKNWYFPSQKSVWLNFWTLGSFMCLAIRWWLLL